MLLYTIDLVGVAVFAISGAIAAARKRLDLLGVIVLAAVTAVGGGTIRDVLLDRHPIFWLADANYVIVIVASALATVAYRHWARALGPGLQLADALGLALFSVSGAQIAERSGLPAVACVLLGTVTGAAGGVVRDVLTAQVPLVLQRGSLYATAAIAGTSVYLLLARLGLERRTAGFLGMALVAGLRLAAIWWNLRLPVFEADDEEAHAGGPSPGPAPGPGS